jgi:hypothetical protein
MRERDDPVTALLKRARKRISHPERWTWGAFARDRSLRSVTPRSGGATSWCAVGALEVEAGPWQREAFGALHEAYARLEAAVRATGHPVPLDDIPAAIQMVERFNDRMGAVREDGHGAVLAVFDEAIRAK